MRVRFGVDFKAIQRQCCQFKLSAADKFGDGFGVALQGLHALQESGEARAQIAALEVSGAE